jgi:hypothetical protein
MQNDSKLLSGFPWPINEKTYNNLESPCIFITYTCNTPPQPVLRISVAWKLIVSRDLILVLKQQVDIISDSEANDGLHFHGSNNLKP